MKNNISIYSPILLFCLALFAQGAVAQSGTEEIDPYRSAPIYVGHDLPTTYGGQIGLKLGSALGNIFGGWLEIPKSMINENNRYNWAVGLFGGGFKGTVNGVGRLMFGLSDLVTFPLPTRPVASPIFVWDDFDEDTNYGPIFRLYE